MSVGREGQSEVSKRRVEMTKEKGRGQVPLSMLLTTMRRCFYLILSLLVPWQDFGQREK